MEVQGLKLSSSFYFADYNHFSQVLSSKSLPESKIIWRLNPLALNVQNSAKHFSFEKRERLFLNLFFLLLTFYTRSLSCLIF